MFLIFFFSFLTFFHLVLPHPITNTLECYYDEDKVVTVSGYSCILTEININVTLQTQKILIAGTHSGNHSNENVVNIKIIASHTPFIMTEVLEAFPEVKGLEIRKSSLQRIQPFALSTAENLKDLIVVDNKIPHIEQGSFNGLAKLEILMLINNHIETISEDAFFGLEKLKVLWMTHNRLTSIEPKTFSSLINLKKLIITHSFLTRLERITFENNKKLQQLLLNDNKISAIDPKLFENLVELEMIKLNDNICVDRDFVGTEKKINKSDLETPLQECFKNFELSDVVENKETWSLVQDSVQKITIEIQGKFTIRNENGDVLYSN